MWAGHALFSLLIFNSTLHVAIWESRGLALPPGVCREKVTALAEVTVLSVATHPPGREGPWSPSVQAPRFIDGVAGDSEMFPLRGLVGGGAEIRALEFFSHCFLFIF